MEILSMSRAGFVLVVCVVSLSQFSSVYDISSHLYVKSRRVVTRVLIKQYTSRD